MAFKLGDFNTEFVLLPEGIELEFYVSDIETKTTSTGRQMLVVNYTVRDDIKEQEEYAGQKIRFDNFVLHPNAMFRFTVLGKAVGFDNDKEYDSEEDFLEEFTNFIKYKPLRIKVKHEKRKNRDGEIVCDEKGQPIYNAVAGAYYITKHHDFIDPETKEEFKNLPIDISDDDLPL